MILLRRREKRSELQQQKTCLLVLSLPFHCDVRLEVCVNGVQERVKSYDSNTTIYPIEMIAEMQINGSRRGEKCLNIHSF